MTMTISTWGRNGLGSIRVRVAVGDSRVDAVGRSIERRTGLHVVTCRADGANLKNGHVESRIYQMTLGLPCRSGGYSVEGEIWVAIPARVDTQLVNGSVAAPGYMNPEGIVIYQIAARTLFKKTLDKDGEPKSAQAQR